MFDSIDPKEAYAHFKRTDPLMADMLKRAHFEETALRLPTPERPNRYFASIVGSIVSQQISVKAADAVRKRVIAAAGDLTPSAIMALDEATLRASGLSSQKTRYIRTNAELWHTLPVRSFATMENEEVITELTKLYGVGRWTAEMFLMFSLARSDVFSFGDYGLMSAIYEHYPVKKHWKRRIAELVDNWAPHRTIASLLLWHKKDNAPIP